MFNDLQRGGAETQSNIFTNQNKGFSASLRLCVEIQ
jgi:hypothetical protein